MSVDEIMDEFNKQQNKYIKALGKRRQEHYGQISDYQVMDVVCQCVDCSFTGDIENFLIAQNNKIIPLTCPICKSQKLKIVDDR